MMQLYRKRAAGPHRLRVAFAASIAVAMLAAPTAGNAQVPQPIPGQADAPAACELHVWPADGIIAVRQRASESMGSSGVLEGILKRTQAATAERRDAQVATALNDEVEPSFATARQISALKHLPLNDFLGLHGYRTIVHDAPLTSREIRMVVTRYDPSSKATCYADLVVDDLIYSREYTRGRKLKSFLRYRNFGASERAMRSFATLVETKLELFSLDPPVMTEAAKNELLKAFAHNLQTFAALAVKQTTRPQSPTTGKE